jgi:hypothetical protein
MRAASLPRFLPSLIYGRTAAFALVLLVVLFALAVLLVFGATGVAAADQAPATDPTRPFRW